MGRSRKNFEFVLNAKFANALFTNKFGGVSKKPYNSLNLGLHVGDDEEDVFKNREILREELGLAKLVFMDQIHSDKIEILNDVDQILNPCDGLITNLKNVGICVMVADCIGVMLISREAIGVVHAGRAGILKKIVSKTINLMKEKFGATNIELFTTPFIQGSCYEIGDLDLGEFNKFVKNHKFDMKTALLDELKNISNLNKNISEICTHCNENYFSYRREKITGRFAGICYLN